MIEIIKIEFKDMPSNIVNEIEDERVFEYYQVNQGTHIIGYFIAYDNEFHLAHKYIYPVKDAFVVVKDKSVVKAIRTHFGKPLQVMIDSDQTEIISMLDQIGFILKRKCFEREFDVTLWINPAHPKVNIKNSNQGTNAYDQSVIMAFDHYVKTHQDVSPLTATKEQFKRILPKQVVCQISGDQILNLVFIDKNEVCYFASKHEAQFESFAHAVIRLMFEQYPTITFEVDSTDELGLKFKSCFTDHSNDSFNTYVYK